MVLYQKFGEWTLMKAQPIRRTAKNVFYLVQCACGNFGEVSPSYLKKGESTRCRKCADKLFYDTHINTPDKPFKYRGNKTHNTWRGMIQRCINPKNNRYKSYGARGITVCERWLESFKNFYDDMGEKPEGYQLDRINNNGSYTKENCRWVTTKQNCNNRNLRAPLSAGDKYGEWTVKEHDKSKKIQHYICICKCGYTASVRMGQLKSGETKQCNNCRIKKLQGIV